MERKEKYDEVKEKLITDISINKDNRKLFKEFFEFEEYKLKRKNNIPVLDNACYKTLYGYLIYLRNANKWFKNKAWKDLTKEDIKKVYDDLEEGRIKNAKGLIYKDRKSYYNKIFKSKPFAMAGKLQLAQEVIEYFGEAKEEVKFIELDTFKKLVNVAIKPEHKFLMWLAWDIGENINSLLLLKKNDFYKEINPDTKEPEYRINLPKENLKRSRQARSELTNFKETTELADIVLAQVQDNELIFPFCYANAKKILNRAVNLTKAKCIPKGQKVTWKDLRSSMACYLLREGWSSDEINSRLGHKPSSKELDKYCNFLAINRHKPKQKIFNNNMDKVQNDIEELRHIIKLYSEREKRKDEENNLKFEDYKKDNETLAQALKVIENKLKK